jgi:ABC-type lipoprotein export system ATPase subunit
MLINVKKLNKSFFINNEKHQILNDLSLAVDYNQIVSLYGASGSGKSTLLNILSGLMSYDSGQINFNNQLIDENFDYVNFRRNDIGIIFQEDHLLSEFNVIENIMLPSIISGNSKKTAYNLAYKLLENFSLLNIKNSYSNILSGGEKQRVSILRAIINKPKFIIADEPTGSIDENNKDKIFTLFKDIISQYDTSILIATHDNNVSKISNKILNLSKGKIN